MNTPKMMKTIFSFATPHSFRPFSFYFNTNIQIIYLLLKMTILNKKDTFLIIEMHQIADVDI